MRIPYARAGFTRSAARFSCLALISLSSCVSADPPEEFVASPGMLDDPSSASLTAGSSNGYNYLIVQGYAVLEGDILLGHVDEHGKLIDSFQARGVGKSDAFNRWPDGVVVYEKPVGSSQIQQDNVEQAIEHWVQNTTLSFVERTADNADQYPHYLKFSDTNSCASHVGMIGGEQPIFISDGCSVGSVIHEIGHAVGLFHEHTRSDRDNFVQIARAEIMDGKEVNFEVQLSNVANYSDYDYGSIMHYGDDFFSRAGRPTIIVPDGISIGQRDALSPLDIASVNAMYQTDLAVDQPVVNSSNSGLEIDISVYNLGQLGANNLQLLLHLDEQSQWVGVSPDSGWECLSFGAELRCTRDTMREQTESRFTVVATGTEDQADTLSVGLYSRTQDSNPANNGVNNDGMQWQSLDAVTLGSDEQNAVNGDQQSRSGTLSQGSPPPLLAARSDEVAKASSGANSWHLLILMLSLAYWRRRRLAGLKIPA